MKKSLSLILALAMIFTLTACGGTPAAPDPEPESISEPDVAPVAAPATIEGVVKEASLNKIIVALADGTELVLDTTGITGLDVGLGDTVKVEYTGEIGSMAASKVEVTAKAEMLTATVSGVVSKIESGIVFMTLEDGTEAGLKTEFVGEYNVEVGDTLTIEYVDDGASDGMTVVSVKVTKAEKPQDALAAGTPNGTSSIPQASGTGSAQATSTKRSSNASANYVVSAVVVNVDSKLFTINQDDGETMILDRQLFEGQLGHTFKVGDTLNVGYNVSGAMGMIAYIELVGFDSSVTPAPAPSVNNGYTNDWGDNDDDEDYGSSESAGDVYEAIRLINAQRVKAGLNELAVDSDLMAMASVRAEEMTTKYSHTRPDGNDWFTVFEDFGSSLWPCAENAGAQSTASQQIASWMNSSGHKANILKKDATRIGVGYSGGRWAMLLSY